MSDVLHFRTTGKWGNVMRPWPEQGRVAFAGLHPGVDLTLRQAA